MAPEAEKSAEGAEAFVRYFWDVYDYSYLILDEKPLDQVSQSECKFCSSAISEIKSFRSASTRKQGAGVSIVAVTSPPVEDPQRLIVIAIINQAAGQTISSTGSVLDIPEIENARAAVALEWNDGSWIVHGINLEAN